MEQQIKQILFDLGADLCGIAHIDRFADAPKGFHPKDLYRNCNSVIVFAKALPKGVLLVDPRIMYAKASEENLLELDRITNLASAKIEALGATAVPLPCDSPYEYWIPEEKEGRGLLSMKHAAYLAGLGSIGKNTLLVNKKFGNRINVGAILTNLVLESDPLVDSYCIPNCRLCLDRCPSKALDGFTANQKRCREYAYGSNARGFSVTNCNTCRVVCPNAAGVLVNR